MKSPIALLLVGAAAALTQVPTGYTSSVQQHLLFVDPIVDEAVRTGLIPGAVVVIGHNDEIVFRKAYGSRALIPRPETETVVERCLALLEGRDAPRVLDVGTGSGAIALAIADEHPGARVTGIDVSAEALSLARENSARTGVAIELLEIDLLSGLPGADWDLVVSNPPYVRPDEATGLAPEVVDWEPHVALFDAGHTETLVRAAAAVLATGGALVLESYDERARAVADLLSRSGFIDVAVTRDLAGRDRVVEGRLRG